jgi:hypothetical protein
MEPSIAHPDSSTAINENHSETSSSDNSFESNSEEEAKGDVYHSTNLITKANQSMADVICEQVTPNMVRVRH